MQGLKGICLKHRQNTQLWASQFCNQARRLEAPRTATRLKGTITLHAHRKRQCKCVRANHLPARQSWTPTAHTWHSLKISLPVLMRHQMQMVTISLLTHCMQLEADGPRHIKHCGKCATESHITSTAHTKQVQLSATMALDVRRRSSVFVLFFFRLAPHHMAC